MKLEKMGEIREIWGKLEKLEEFGGIWKRTEATESRKVYITLLYSIFLSL